MVKRGKVPRLNPRSVSARLAMSKLDGERRDSWLEKETVVWRILPGSEGSFVVQWHCMSVHKTLLKRMACKSCVNGVKRKAMPSSGTPGTGSMTFNRRNSGQSRRDQNHPRTATASVEWNFSWSESFSLRFRTASSKLRVIYLLASIADSSIQICHDNTSWSFSVNAPIFVVLLNGNDKF